MVYHSNGRTEKIIEMAHQGRRKSEIAKVVGCTKSNVTMTLRRFGTGHGLGAELKVPLEAEYRAWIIKEAHANGITPSALIRSIVVDAVNEERSKAYGRQAS